MERAGGYRRQHYYVTLAALTLAASFYALQQTMVIPALPALQRDLHTSTAWVTWLLTGFLLVASVAAPVLGKLGDQYGKERLLLISLVVFLVACVGAIFAWNIWSMILCRTVAGVGGAVFPLSFSIINDEFPEEKVGMGIGMVSSVFAAGGALGLVASGLIVDNTSWRWLFVVGSLGVAVAVVLVYLFVPESPVKTETRVDYLGAVLLSLGLISLLLALTEGEGWGWMSGRILGLFAAAFLFLVAWGVAELRVPEPMVDMRMLAKRPVLFANLTGLIAGFGMFGAFILVPNFVESPRGLPASLAHLVHYGFGASATKAGLYLLPGALIGFASGPAAGFLARRYGSKLPLVLGLVLAAGGLGMLAEFHAHPWQIVVSTALLVGGLPFTFAAMANIVVASVRPGETGIATGMNAVMRTVGGVVGGQVSAAILTADRIARTPLPNESAFTTAFWVGAAGVAVAAFIALHVTPLRLRRQPQPAARLERDT